METLLNLCRCCLSSESKVSLFDTDINIKQKFHEITSIQVKNDDGLPQKLCDNCFEVMNSAYQFRSQCIKMDRELKAHLDTIQTTKIVKNNYMTSVNNTTKVDNYDTDHITIDNGLKLITVDDMQNDEDDLSQDTDSDFASNPMKQLEAIIKTEPHDSDDDYYYVLVIDDPKNEGKQLEVPIVKKEDQEIKDLVHENFEDSIDSFLVTEPKVPDNVPATILQNQEEDDGNFDNVMNMETDDSQDINSFDQNNIIVTRGHNNIDTLKTITTTYDTLSDTKNSYIKILTASDHDGKIILKGTDSVAYLADSSNLGDDDDDALSQEEVVVYEEGDSSQLQLLNCDGELVIEYADESQIATVLQQDDGTLLCDCGEQFDDLESYEKHQYTHNTSDEHLCSLCGKSFESNEVLTCHMLLHKATGLFLTCPFCNQLMKRTALTQHIKYSHNNIKPKCKLCMKTFANSNNLKRHMMIHSGVRQFECDICFKRFHQKITMQTHRLTHVDPFSCTQCDKSFQGITELNQHKESQECTKSKVSKIRDDFIKAVKQEIITEQGKLLGYACSLCKKMFSLEKALDQHIESRHIVDRMELYCSECGEVQGSKKELQSHMLMHNNAKNRIVKRFECSICRKGCSSQAMLIMHERVHTNERPFSCQLCTLKFKTKTHLRTHQLTHTREKKFGCSVCMKFFALKGNLVVHLRTHTGDRPYVCNLCNEAFIDSKYLRKHKDKKHGIGNVPWNIY